MHCVTMCWYVCLFVVVVLFIVALYSLSRMFPQTITVCSLLVASIVHCLFVACLSRKAKTCLFVILFVCCVVLFVLFVMFVLLFGLFCCFVRCVCFVVCLLLCVQHSNKRTNKQANEQTNKQTNTFVFVYVCLLAYVALLLHCHCTL